VRLFPVETFEKLFGSRYAVVVVAARRAMRIREGSEPLVDVDSKNPLTIALTELAAGMIHPAPPAEGEEEELVAEEELALEGESAEAVEADDEAAGLSQALAEAVGTDEADAEPAEDEEAAEE
jgi:DNA-directed RNA polymerase subunit omega